MVRALARRASPPAVARDPSLARASHRARRRDAGPFLEAVSHGGDRWVFPYGTRAVARADVRGRGRGARDLAATKSFQSRTAWSARLASRSRARRGLAAVATTTSSRAERRGVARRDRDVPARRKSARPRGRGRAFRRP